MVTAATRRGRTIRSNLVTEDVATNCRPRRDRRCRHVVFFFFYYHVFSAEHVWRLAALVERASRRTTEQPNGLEKPTMENKRRPASPKDHETRA